MADLICFSPLRFYDDVNKQNHRKSYAYNNISPILTKLHTIPSFQFIIPGEPTSSEETVQESRTLEQYLFYDFQTGIRRQEQSACGIVKHSVEGADKIIYTNLASILNVQYCYLYKWDDNNYLGYEQIYANNGTIEYEVFEGVKYVALVFSKYIEESTTVTEELYYADHSALLTEASLIDAHTDTVVYNLLPELLDNNFAIYNIENYQVAMYNGNLTIQFDKEGMYYIRLTNQDQWEYYSEVFSITNSTDNCIELEYRNNSGNFYLKNGLISFANNFYFKVMLQTEIGKPEYSFEEEATKRLGYSFVESQVSKKIYKFTILAPEYLCDALRIVRLCDIKAITTKYDTFEPITFDMNVEWQEQGDLASVTCEFEVDTVITNFGGPLDFGDYNKDYSSDYDNR